MNDIAVLALSLLAGAGLLVAGLIGYFTVLKPRRRKALERAHARNKTKKTA